jgi:hypothetical protein
LTKPGWKACSLAGPRRLRSGVRRRLARAQREAPAARRVEDADVTVGDRSLRVSTPDGIVAEKLRALVPAGEGPSQGRARLQNRFSGL